MLKKILILSAISSSSLMAPIAMADTSDSGFYLTAGVGTGLETDIDSSIDGIDFSATGRTKFSGGFGLGYDFPENNWRVEAGVIRSLSEVDTITVDGSKYDVDENGTATGLSVAVAYDFENDSKITPFIGGSIGRIWAEDVDASTSYGVDFGLSTPVSDNMEFWGAVGLGISTEETNDIDGSSVKTDGCTAWGFSTGLRIRL